MEHGGRFSFLSIVFAAIAWISLKDAQTIVTMLASGISFLSGAYSLYVNWKKKKKNNL
jgi:hypothetical protein